LKEAARVLAPAGLLIASTPNRRYYSEERGYTNPFHIREYDAEEFDRLIEPFFPCRMTFVQNHAAAISFFPLDRGQAGAARGEAGFGPADAADPGAAPDEPHFLVALASRQEVPAAGPYVFVPSSANVLRQRETHIAALEKELVGGAGGIRQLQQEHEETVTWARGLEAELGKAREALDARQQELDERTLWTQQLDREIERLENLALGLQRELKTKTEWAVSLDEELGRARQEIDKRDRELIEKVEWAHSLQADLERARRILDERQTELDDRTAWAFRLHAEVERAATQNLELNADNDRLRSERDQLTVERRQLQATVEERTAWALRLDAEAESLRADMRLILGSIWYRLGKKLRLGPVPRVDRERGKQ